MCLGFESETTVNRLNLNVKVFKCGWPPGLTTARYHAHILTSFHSAERVTMVIITDKFFVINHEENKTQVGI